MDAIRLTPKSSAVLIRTILKGAFPATTFSVVTGRGSMVSSVHIAWTDGPTPSAVDELVKPFEDGQFDGMTDSYNYNKGADRYLVINGQTYERGVRYVFTERTISPELANRCIAQIAEYWGGVELVPRAVPTKWGRGYALEPEVGRRPVREDLSQSHDDWYSSIHRAASNHTEFARATVEG